MKKLCLMVTLCLVLCGCGGKNQALSEVIGFRELAQQNPFQFDADITADYGTALHEFRLHCVFDREGNMTFTVLQPESIAEVTGEISDEGGKLTFDEKVLAFEMLADGQITPVSAPWILVKSLRGGYIHGCGETDDGILAQMDDSYADDAVSLDVRFTENIIPRSGEILWQGRRILTIQIENFAFM